MSRRDGQFLVEDYFTHTGGRNTADSPFIVSSEQSVGGKNYDNLKTGGFGTRRGHTKINTSADTQTKTLGIRLWNNYQDSRLVIRAAGTKVQNFAPSTLSFTNLSEDTTSATTDFLTSGSTQPVVGAMFNTETAAILWLAGAGSSSLLGAYSSTKVTRNGAVTPTGSLTVAASASGSSQSFSSIGYYRYGVAFRKTSTSALSNVSLFKEVNVDDVTKKVTVTFSTITNVDSGKYDKIYVYRSPVSVASQGDTAFTVGDLISISNISDTSYVDEGAYSLTAQNVPQANNLVSDNSELPSGTYKTACLFKRRLVTSSGSTLYLSDINKSESWPTVQRINVPSGGEIKAVGVISLTTATSPEVDELLCIFKDNEVWVLTGDGVIDDYGLPNWSLKFIDSTGCPSQSLLVEANGYLSWVGYSGVYLWEGTGKPVLVSRPIEDLFAFDGDIDMPKLYYGWGTYSKRRREIIWQLSHKEHGEQVFTLRLDMRLTIPRVQETLGQRITDGVFVTDVTPFALYAGSSFIFNTTTQDEQFFMGDSSGFVYDGFSGGADGSSDIAFQYDTPFLNLGSPSTEKRIAKVVVWVEDLGDWDLTLRFVARYRNNAVSGTSQALPISDRANVAAIWDIGDWDIGFWDDYEAQLVPLTFNLSSIANNLEGEAFQFSFRHTGSDEPITVLGYSVYYSILPSRK